MLDMEQQNPSASIFGNVMQMSNLELRREFIRVALSHHPDIVPEIHIDEFRSIAYAFEQVRWSRVFLWTGEREIELPNRVMDWSDFTLQDAFLTFGRVFCACAESPHNGDQVVPFRIEIRDVLLGNYKSVRVLRDVLCSECNGAGVVLKATCPICSGKGLQRIEEKINVEVPPGSTTGNVAVFPGKGHYIAAQKRTGDLWVVFEEILPGKLQRKGVDCYCEAEVDVSLLALGGTASTENLMGERVYFKIPPGTQTGRLVAIPGQGFPQYRTRSWGNLQCRVLPKLPALDRGERELFMRLRELSVQRSGVQYRTQGRFGVLMLRPENDTPMIAEELVDLAVVLQTSGLVPAVDLTALVPFAPRSILNALVAVYNRCFQRGQMKVLATPEVAMALKNLQIGALFEILIGTDEFEGPVSAQAPSPFLMYRKGRWEVYPMGASSLICDHLLGTPDLLENLEPQGLPFKVYDLSQVPQIDSFLIGKLIRVYKYALASGGEVVLSGVKPSVASVLKDTGISSLFRQIQGINELSD